MVRTRFFTLSMRVCVFMQSLVHTRPCEAHLNRRPVLQHEGATLRRKVQVKQEIFEFTTIKPEFIYQLVCVNKKALRRSFTRFICVSGLDRDSFVEISYLDWNFLKCPLKLKSFTLIHIELCVVIISVNRVNLTVFDLLYLNLI